MRPVVAVPLRRPEPPGPPGPRLWPEAWLAILGIAALVVSEYSLRRRSQQSSLAGEADGAVVVELLVYGLVAAFLVLQLVRPSLGPRLHPLLVALWGFTLAMLLAATWSPFPMLATARGMQLVVMTSLAHLMARHASPAALSRLAHAFVVLCVGSIGLGLAVPYPSLPQAEGRFTWLYVHPNVSSVFLAVGAVVALALALRRRQEVPGAPWPEGLYWAALAVQLVGLGATRSRGAFAGALLGLVAVGFVAGRRRSRVDLLVFGLAVTAMVWIVAATDVLTFLQRGDSAEELGTLSSRTRVWGQAWQLFSERPLLGHGFMSARGAFLDAFGLGGAHNALIEVLVNSGVFGVFWWMAAVVLAVREGVRLAAARHPDAPLLLGVLGALLGTTLTAGGLGQAATVQAVWFALLVGWLLAAPRLRWEDPPAAVPRRAPATALMAAGRPPGRVGPQAGGRRA